MTDNRRQFSRIAFHTEARLYADGKEFAVEVRDLSLKGALVRPERPVELARGTPAVVQVRLDEMGTLIRIAGHIAHIDGDSFGVACEEIDLDSITHLRRHVELNLGDEALLERELHHLAGA